MRPKIIWQLKTKQSYSHLCISLCHPIVRILWGYWHVAVLGATLERNPHRKAGLGWGRHGKLLRKPTQHAARKELTLPWQVLGSCKKHLIMLTLLWRRVWVSVSTQGSAIPPFSALCYGLSSVPLLRERQREEESPHELPGEHFAFVNLVPHATI